MQLVIVSCYIIGCLHSLVIWKMITFLYDGPLCSNKSQLSSLYFFILPSVPYIIIPHVSVIFSHQRAGYAIQYESIFYYLTIFNGNDSICNIVNLKHFRLRVNSNTRSWWSFPQTPTFYFFSSSILFQINVHKVLAIAIYLKVLVALSRKFGSA